MFIVRDIELSNKSFKDYKNDLSKKIYFII